MADISPGWQRRAVELQETIRDCQHDKGLLTSALGVPFCARCGFRVTDPWEQAIALAKQRIATRESRGAS